MGNIVEINRGQDGSNIMESEAETNAVEHQVGEFINFFFSDRSWSHET